MSKIITLKENPELLRVVRLAEPRYRKHKAIYSEQKRFTVHGSYWSGGSKESSCIVTPTGKVQHIVMGTAPPHFGGAGPIIIDIPAGHYIVTTGIFCGKTATVKIVKGI